MQVKVDHNKCETAGRCVQACPEVFRFHEGSKKAYVFVDEIPASLEKQVRLAADKCPNMAIEITD